MAILDRDRKLLWGNSGLRCAICKRRLSVDPLAEGDRETIVGEECHIVGQGRTGPRAGEIPFDQINLYANLILLCNTDHTTVDDQTNHYTSARLRAIKVEHEAWVDSSLNPVMIAREVEAEVPSKGKGSTVVLDTFPLPAYLPFHVPSYQIFSERLSDGFPGQLGAQELVDPEAALDRIDVILRHPIEQLGRQSNGDPYETTPFYWLRGGRNMHVDHYERLDPRHCLMGIEELRVSKVMAYRSRNPYRDFLYVEVDPDQPSGAYQYSAGYITEMLADREGGIGWGPFVDEEFAVWKGHVLTRQQFDDAAAIIEGRPQRTSGAELRARYLTKYNLILCGNLHVFNQPPLDQPLQRLLDRILRGEASSSDLIPLAERAPLTQRIMETR